MFDLLHDLVVILSRAAVLLDKVHHRGHLLIGDETALHPGGLSGSQREVEHIAPAHQLLGPLGVQDDPGLHGGGHGEGDPAGDVGLHQAGDYIGGGPLGGDDQVHPAGAAHLGYPADGLLHLLGGHQHQVGQLIDDHHHLGHLLHALSPGRLGVVGGQVTDSHLGEHPVALHHLGHRPLEGARRLFRVGDHRDEQVRDAIIDPQFYHLRVNHDEADLLRAGLVQQGDDQGVGTHRLTGAGGAGDEQMRQLCNVAHDALAADVLAHGEGHLGGAVLELRGAEHSSDVHRGDQLVGHLDAHHGDLSRDGGDPHPGGPQGQGDVVGQVGQLVQPDTLIQLQLIPGDRGPPGDVDNIGVDAEGVDGVGQALLVGVEFHQGLSPQLSAPLGEQLQRRVLIGRRLQLHPGLDVLGHLLGRLLALRIPARPGDGRLPHHLRHGGRRGLSQGLGSGSRNGFRCGGRLRLPQEGRGGVLLWFRENGLRRRCGLGNRLRDRRRGGGGLRLRLSDLGRSSGQHLIRGRDPGPAIKEAFLLFHRGGCGRLLPHEGAVLHWNVDLRCPAAGVLRDCRPAGGGPCAAGPLRDLLGLILGPVEDPVGHIQNGEAERPQGHEQEGQHKDHSGSPNAHRLDQRLGQHSGGRAAAGHGPAALPQRLEQGSVPGQDLDRQPVDRAGHYQGHQQGAHHRKAHRTPAVEGQDIAGQQKGRGHQPEAVPDQPLHQPAEEIDEEGLDVKIAQGREKGQQQAGHRPDLPAEGPVSGLGRLLFPSAGCTAPGSGAGTGGGGPPSAG